jgi:hypothetical protein
MLLVKVTECGTAVVGCQSVKQRSSDELQYINQPYDTIQIIKHNSRKVPTAACFGAGVPSSESR